MPHALGRPCLMPSLRARRLLAVAVIALAACLVACEGDVSPAFDGSQPSDLERAAAHDWAAARFRGQDPPFSFMYGGRRSSEFLPSWTLRRSSRVIDPDRLERTLTYADPKTGLEVRCVGVEYSDFPTVEWTVTLRNGGPAKSPLVEDLLAADFDLVNASGGEYLLHHNVGSLNQPNDFHYVTGLLAYWDELLRRDPDRWIDTCASGGRRNDLETLRRAAPLLRSDFTADPVAHQSHTYGLSLWLPWYGSGAGTDDLYLLRSSVCPAWRIGHDMRRTGDDYDRIRREVENFRRIEGFLLGDYYPLAPYSQEQDVWMAFQFDSPEKGGGAVLAFRRKDCPDEARRFKLHGLDRGAIYEVTDPDTGEVVRLSGAALTDDGAPVRIAARPGAVWLSYRKSRR